MKNVVYYIIAYTIYIMIYHVAIYYWYSDTVEYILKFYFKCSYFNSL